MKKAGELLAAFFDEEFIKKAQGYSDLSRSWKSIAGENIAAHSRIVDLVRSILVIEADHPGWIQILQTKQKSLLDGVSRRFPNLSIVGISFRLSRNTAGGTEAKVAESADLLSVEAETGQEKIVTVLPETDVSVTGKGSVTAETAREADADRENSDTGRDPYAKITDEHFRETFKRLEQDIKKRGKSRR
ncbi:hypothetical protein FACS1894130_07750 [Spirochaetia bacterium]|nr:hypothetical protein FACS1894130_07750 [Spirochaetia bacterium]